MSSYETSRFLGRQPNSLIGRRGDLRAVKERILRSDVQLLTLTGVAGVGKTRLALQVMEEIRQEFVHITFVDLAPLTDLTQVLPAIARSCNVLEGAMGPLIERLASAIGSRRVLIVLDNCEHLLKAMQDLSNLLSLCPNLKILATSREILRLKWEWVFPVPPLQLPELKPLPRLSTLANIPAVALFVQRARFCDSAFKLTKDNSRLIAELCVRLDGLPLAIELAATQVNLLGLKELLERLNQNLDLEIVGTRDIPDRHQTLWAAIDWSHNLLNHNEKVLFQRLSVFSGGWSFKSAEEVCGGDGLKKSEILPLLEKLINCSLVQSHKQPDGEIRYRFLETLHDYARERLRQSGTERDLQNKHLDWFLAWAEQGEPHLWGSGMPIWMDQIETDFANIWNTLEWCRITPGKAGTGLRLFAAICRFFDTHGRFVEGLRAATDLLALAPEHTIARSRTLTEASILARNQGDWSSARSMAEECYTLANELGDTLGSSASLWVLGSLAQVEGNVNRARELFTEAVEVSRPKLEEDPKSFYFSICYLAFFNSMNGDYKRAIPLFEDALAYAKRCDDCSTNAVTLVWLGQALLGNGDITRSTTVLLEGLEASREVGYKEMIAHCLDELGQAACLQKDGRRAERLLGAAAALRCQIGVIYWVHDRFREQILTAINMEAVLANQAIAQDLFPEKIIDWALNNNGCQVILENKELQSTSNGTKSILSSREWEIASMIANGLGNRQIAGTLYVSKRTVDAHIRNILSKLEIKSRVQIASWYTMQNK